MPTSFRFLLTDAVRFYLNIPVIVLCTMRTDVGIHPYGLNRNCLTHPGAEVTSYRLITVNS